MSYQLDRRIRDVLPSSRRGVAWRTVVVDFTAIGRDEQPVHRPLKDRPAAADS
jgi:hypothetical protein